MLSVTDKSRTGSGDQQRYTLGSAEANGIRRLEAMEGSSVRNSAAHVVLVESLSQARLHNWNSGVTPKGQFRCPNPSIIIFLAQACCRMDKCFCRPRNTLVHSRWIGCRFAFKDAQKDAPQYPCFLSVGVQKMKLVR
jgi:hypothetical protein